MRSALTEAAWGASRTKDTYLTAQHHRLAARQGRKRAIVAVGHSILVAAYCVLLRGQNYLELGGNCFDQRERAPLDSRLVHRLEKLGLKATVERLPVAA